MQVSGQLHALPTLPLRNRLLVPSIIGGCVGTRPQPVHEQEQKNPCPCMTMHPGHPEQKPVSMTVLS